MCWRLCGGKGDERVYKQEDMQGRIAFLLDYLLKERPEFAGAQIPERFDEAFTLYRALVNMRQPLPVSDEFLRTQDAMLQQIAREKGIVDVADLAPTAFDERLALWQGDITALRIDAIVNAANSALLGCFVPGHHCIDNAIHTFAGVQLRQACSDIMRAQAHPEPTGAAKITPAFNLPARFVVHTVGPITNGHPTEAQRRQLADCYASCLRAAEGAGCASIAFCCISTGEFRYPAAEAARVAIDAVRAYLDGGSAIDRVVFNVFLDKDQAIYERLLQGWADPA